MRFLPFVLLLFSLDLSAQWKSYILNRRGDTLNRTDMSGKKQGPWSVRVEDLRGERGYEEEGFYENDLKTGTWKKYSLEGVKIAEENYNWGKLNGRSYYYTYNGGLLREENWRAIDPKNKYDTVPIYDLKDPTKEIDRVVVKNEGVSMKHGRFVYYDPLEGTIEETQHWVMNKLQSDDELIDEELAPIGISSNKPRSDTSGKKTVQKPQAVLDYEKKNSGKKKIKARDGNTGY